MNGQQPNSCSVSALPPTWVLIEKLQVMISECQGMMTSTEHLDSILRQVREAVVHTSTR